MKQCWRNLHYFLAEVFTWHLGREITCLKLEDSGSFRPFYLIFFTVTFFILIFLFACTLILLLEYCRQSPLAITSIGRQLQLEKYYVISLSDVCVQGKCNLCYEASTTTETISSFSRNSGDRTDPEFCPQACKCVQPASRAVYRDPQSWGGKKGGTKKVKVVLFYYSFVKYTRAVARSFRLLFKSLLPFTFFSDWL